MNHLNYIHYIFYSIQPYIDSFELVPDYNFHNYSHLYLFAAIFSMILLSIY